MGKKFKPPKPRIPIVAVELREDTQITWDNDTGTLRFLNAAGETSTKHLVSIGQAYQREGKTPKILRQMVNRLGGDVNIKSTVAYHDRYLGIDTSYRLSGEKLICATGALLVDQTLDHEKGLAKGDQLLGLVVPRLCFCFKRGWNPERYGWMKAIDGLTKWEKFNPDFTYGIVVDSELGLLPKINAREEPVFGDFFLPTNMSMIYASADAGQENFYNLLIRATDRVAASTLDEAMRLFPSHETIVLDEEHCDLTVITSQVEIKF